MTPPKLRYVAELDLPMAERTVPGVLRAAAEARPDREALVFEAERLTFAQLAARVDGLATTLAGHGLRHGTHVALLMDNSADLVCVLLALARLGAVSIPVNTAAKGAQLLSYLDRFDATCLLADTEHVPAFARVAADCPRVELLVVRGAAGDAGDAEGSALPGHVRRRAWDAPFDGPADPLPQVRFRDTLTITLTSGTSGPSKGTVATHAGQLSSAIAYARAFGYGERDRIYVCLPLFHASAFVTGCLTALLTGATVVLVRRFSGRRFWSDVREHGVTRVSALGSMVNILWGLPPTGADADNDVATFLALPVPEFADGFEQRFGVRFVSVYGSTDYTVAAMLTDAAHPPRARRSAGRVRPEVEVRILDDDDLDVPAGRSGEICVRALDPWIASQGYYGVPAETLAAHRNGWFHSGDLGHLDEDGYLFYDGRRTDSMRRRGENISAFEVEQVVATHPLVADVAAYAVPSELAEDEVMVSVVPVAGALLRPWDLIAFCEQNMARFMVPRYVDVVTDLPRTPTHKVEKRRLRADAAADLSRFFDRERATRPG